MKHLLRILRLGMVTLLLALGGLAAALGMPAAHAAPTALVLTNPTIKTSVFFYGSPEGATLNVQGSGFTPSGSVLVEEFDSGFHLVLARTVTASPYCRGGVIPICGFSGAFSTGFEFVDPPVPPKTYYVIAYDYGSGKWSNWSSQAI
jgi:hypothetical protein